MAAARRASGQGRLEAPDATAIVDNPLCGDRVTVDVRRAGRAAGAAGTEAAEAATAEIAEIGQVVRGCVLCEAAAAVIVEAGTGADEAELRAASEQVRRMIEDGGSPPEGGWKKAEMFLPVRAHPSRHDCVLLPFQALLRALDGEKP